MAKQQKVQQYCLKLNSNFLAKHNWDLQLSIEEARRSPGIVVSLADSQILTWINELNGTENYDELAREIRHEIKLIKKQKNTNANRQRIKELYAELYRLQFKEDYLCLIMDKKSHYDRANKGFKVNGIEYRRLLTTVNGVKTATVVYTSLRLHDELKKRIDNNRNKEVKLVPAKLGAYEALCSSASIPVSWPHGIIVVRDVLTHFKADLINVDDSDSSKEPVVEFKPMQDVENNASDGCSMMMPSLSRRWNGELGGDPEETMSGCNLRCAWTKGMTFTFDYVEWAEKNVGSYIVKDIWGVERDLRDSELIITEGQLKLWSAYSSWEDYYNCCLENHYTFRIAKTSPEEVDDVRQLNYQFIQPHELNDDDIVALVSPTVDEIQDIMRFDYKKSIVYLCGTGLNETNVSYASDIAKALMINKNMIDDPYISSKIKNMIQKRIREAKIGVLNVHGNFQIISGDLVCLCESMFGLEPKGLLKAGEIYSQYWRELGVNKVVCYRAPMSNKHSIRGQNICYTEESAYWFRYIKTCIVVNAWDTMSRALNGFDFDGDLLFTTNNEVLLRTYRDVPALNCIQYNAAKKAVEEADVVVSNKLGFGSKIGSITNRITAMTSLMVNFPLDSQEYKMLEYRTQCGQAQQQAEIDKAKGIISTPMPKSWYVLAENKIKPDDSEEEVCRKRLYQRICAHKKPYFFAYNYPSLKREYDNYINQANEKSCVLFGKSLEKLDKSDVKQEKFLKTVENNLPLDRSPGVMNKICWFVENKFSNLKFPTVEDFDRSMLKSGQYYSLNTYREIEQLYKLYKKKISALSKKVNSAFYSETEEMFENKQQVQEWFAENCEFICPNALELCEILVDICYRGRNDKEPVWFVCGETIVSNLLKKNNNTLYYPEKTTSGAEFECCGKTFVMKKMKIAGGDFGA